MVRRWLMRRLTWAQSNSRKTKTLRNHNQSRRRRKWWRRRLFENVQFLSEESIDKPSIELRNMKEIQEGEGGIRIHTRSTWTRRTRTQNLLNARSQWTPLLQLGTKRGTLTSRNWSRDHIIDQHKRRNRSWAQLRALTHWTQTTRSLKAKRVSSHTSLTRSQKKLVSRWRC